MTTDELVRTLRTEDPAGTADVRIDAAEHDLAVTARDGAVVHIPLGRIPAKK